MQRVRNLIYNTSVRRSSFFSTKSIAIIIFSPISNNNGIIIYLKSSAEKIFNRTSSDKIRPLLQGNDRLSKIKEILFEREPIYSSVANETINTDTLSTQEIIREILKIIEKT